MEKKRYVEWVPEKDQKENLGLEEILQLLGAEKPFEDSEDLTGDLTPEGERAYYKLIRIVNGLDYIGALGKKGDELESYLDEIIRLGF